MVDRRSFVAGLVAGAAGGGVAGGAFAMSRHRVGSALGRMDQPADQLAHGTVSYSQMGEDVIACGVLAEAMRIEKPTYVDIGAADPIDANNTYLAHVRGGHGVLVEPNPAYQERLHRERPRDVIVSAGVGVTDATEADYYLIRNAPMRNTFSRDDVEYLRKQRGHDVVERVVRIPLISINHLIERHLGVAPDVLSTDVEGLDYAILQTLDFGRYRPAIIIAETQPVGPIPTFLVSKGYEVRGVTLHNVIFADPRRYSHG